MTRRGSLAYYLAAWICGSTFASLALWFRGLFSSAENPIPGPAGAAFFSFCFLGLILGLVPSVLIAFILRIFARAIRLRRIWQWMLAGGLFSILICPILALLNRNATAAMDMPRLMDSVARGPALLMAAAWWFPAMPGALAALPLCRIEIAFAEAKRAAESEQSRASTVKNS